MGSQASSGFASCSKAVVVCLPWGKCIPFSFFLAVNAEKCEADLPTPEHQTTTWE